MRGMEILFTFSDGFHCYLILKRDGNCYDYCDLNAFVNKVTKSWSKQRKSIDSVRACPYHHDTKSSTYRSELDGHLSLRRVTLSPYHYVVEVRKY